MSLSLYIYIGTHIRIYVYVYERVCIGFGWIWYDHDMFRDYGDSYRTPAASSTASEAKVRGCGPEVDPPNDIERLKW